MGSIAYQVTRWGFIIWAEADTTNTTEAAALVEYLDVRTATQAGIDSMTFLNFFIRYDAYKALQMHLMPEDAEEEKLEEMMVEDEDED